MSPPTKMVVSVSSRFLRSRPMRLRELQLAAVKKEADEEAREEELDRRRKTTAPCQPRRR